MCEAVAVIQYGIQSASIIVQLYLHPATALLFVEALRLVNDAEGDSILRESEGK